jgi:hypothetical protein
MNRPIPVRVAVVRRYMNRPSGYKGHMPGNTPCRHNPAIKTWVRCIVEATRTTKEAENLQLWTTCTSVMAVPAYRLVFLELVQFQCGIVYSSSLLQLLWQLCYSSVPQLLLPRQ